MWSFLIILMLTNGDLVSLVQVDGLEPGHRFQSQNSCEQARRDIFELIKPPAKGQVLEFTFCVQDPKDA